MSYVTELHMTYQTTISAFLSSYSKADAKLSLDLDNYSRACAMFLWHAFSVDTRTCTKAINAIYTSDSNRIVFFEEQVATAMMRMQGKRYKMPVPEFFKSLIRTDRCDGTNVSRRLISCFRLILLSFALIDGTVEVEEARLISNMAQTLVNECDMWGILPYNDEIDVFQYVADRFEDNFEPIVTADVNTADDESLNPMPAKSASNPKSAPKQTVQKPHAPRNRPLDELNNLIGLSNVKSEIKEICDFAAIQQMRQVKGLPVSNISLHLIFTGNPGTGKTTVARIVAQIYKELGLLSKGHLIEASAKDLVAGYVGQTAIKTSELIAEAEGGILFVDEAYTLLDKAGQGYGQEAIDTLLKEMEDRRGDFAVIVAGYDELMREFIHSNPGLKSRFNRFVHFDNYNENEMLAIFKLLCRKNAYLLEPSSEEILRRHFAKLCKSHGDDFANGRTARNLFESIISKQATRIASVGANEENLSLILPEDVLGCISDGQNDDESIESILHELDELIGLAPVKDEISDLVKLVQHQQKRKSKGLKVPPLSLHLVFLGNPGTGKTTIARLVARIYKTLGLLSKGQLIETDRSGLVAGYVGQTAIKTQNIINTAIGGVLFIDEAYTLSTGNQNDFGQEAIDTLLKAMEDRRDDFVVIVAGYSAEMDVFIHSNPGLESRFNRYVYFEDYSPEEMMEIFLLLCRKNQYELSSGGRKALSDYFSSCDMAEIANGRGARNLFEKVVTQQAIRMDGNQDNDGADLSTILSVDIERALHKGGEL